MKKTASLLSLCLVAACGGGGGGGTATEPVAVSPSPSAPPSILPPAPVPAPTPAPGVDSPATAPAAGTGAAPVLATSYPTTDLTCVVGDPGYWERAWRLGYDGGAFRLQPLPPPGTSAAPAPVEPVQVVAWNPAAIEATSDAGASQFAATAADGRRLTLRVAADGTPVGFAIQDPASAPLRCGTFAAGATMATPVTSQFACQWSFPANGPIETPPDLPGYVATITLDRTAFPWTRLAVTSDPQLFDDRDGTEIRTSDSRYWSVDPNGAVSVYIGPPFNSEGTTYTLRNGAVIGAEVSSRSAAGPVQTCTPL